MLLVLVVGWGIFSGCRKEEPPLPPGTEVPLPTFLDSSLVLKVNPSGLAPLSALVIVPANRRLQLEMVVPGPPDVEVQQELEGLSSVHIHGLLPGRVNEVALTFTDSLGLVARATLQIPTDPLPEFFPRLEVLQHDAGRSEPGWNLVELSVGGGGTFRFYPFIFDERGQVRWYLNLSQFDGWVGPFKRASDGNWLFAFRNQIYKYDMLGRLVRQWTLEGFGQHHEITELENGRFLIAVSKWGQSTGLDWVIEYNPATLQVERSWDLRQVLDMDRFDFIFGGNDWLHVNSLWPDADGGLVISARNQGVFKVSADNQLQWILAPHKGWGNAGIDGSGPPTEPYLLTAVDAQGAPYPDSVQTGWVGRPDFDWPWGQHAAMLLPNGNVFLFDNGLHRYFSLDAPRFSRGVEYAIDPNARTVRQVWQFGRERGDVFYSHNISDVDLLPQTGNRLICPGNIEENGVREARIVEVAHPSGEVVFEAVIDFANLFSNGGNWGQSDIVYRCERLPLLPDVQ